MRTKDELFRAAQREVAAYRQQAVMQAETARRAVGGVRRQPQTDDDHRVAEQELAQNGAGDGVEPGAIRVVHEGALRRVKTSIDATERTVKRGGRER